MVKRVKKLSSFQKNLVKGYYRQNAGNSYIPAVVMKLSMIYLYILDEFTSPLLKNISNSKAKKKKRHALLHNFLGFNRSTICYIPDSGGMTALGKNRVSLPYRFHHWHFRVVSVGGFNVDREFDFMVGVRAVGGTDSRMRGFIGSHGFKVHMVKESYSNKKFCRPDDRLDMYLDLERGQLSYVLNNTILGVAFDNLDTSQTYRVQCAVTNADSALEMVAYHSAKSKLSTPTDQPFNHHAICETLHCIRATPDLKEQRVLFERVLAQYGVGMREVNNDYFDCLVALRDFDAFHDFLEAHDFALTVTCKGNLCMAGSYFYLQSQQFAKALHMLSLLDNETLLQKHLSVELAFCYENAREWTQAVKYYKLSLTNKEGKLGERGRNEVLHHLGAVQFNHLDDYEAALATFLEIGEREICRRDLESAIASCYDQLRQPEMALKYFKRYEAKYPDRPTVLLAVAVVHWKLGNMKTADEYFERALAMDALSAESNTWMLHSKYGYYLLNGKDDYAAAMVHFRKSLDVAQTPHQQTESFKCIGATFDKLGDMDQAISYTQKVLDANPNDADALNNAGYFHLTMGKYEDAYRHLKRSLELCPNGELTTGNLGICLFEMGEFEKALPFLRRAVHEKPHDLEHPNVGPRCLECLARCLFEHTKEYTQSAAVLKQLVEHPACGSHKAKDEVLYLLSTVCQKMGNFGASVKALQGAKKINPQRAALYEKEIRMLKQRVQ